jgi:hypothetical protein
VKEEIKKIMYKEEDKNGSSRDNVTTTNCS